MADRYVVFSHGKDSEPWGTKISALARVARAEGYKVESVDYRGIDSVNGRVDKLIQFCKGVSGELVLVGSSLGGFIAAEAAGTLHARGIFLMAPAFYIDGLPLPRAVDPTCPVTIVHGWRDEVIPVDNAIRYARDCGAVTHLLNDDHRLLAQLRRVCWLFESFLLELDQPSGVAASSAP